MFHGAPSTIGGFLVLMILLLIIWRLGSGFPVSFRLMLFLIFTTLVVILLNPSPMPVSSSAAPPACLDGFIVETNGGTGGAHTCTHPF